MTHISSHIIIFDDLSGKIDELKEHFENMPEEQKEKVLKAVEKANKALEDLD